MEKNVERKCSGCLSCNNGLVKPGALLSFEDEDEMEAFWARHEIANPAGVQFVLAAPAVEQLESIRNRISGA